jgi:Bacterial regulatory helix-turn-helix protein, lysR family
LPGSYKHYTFIFGTIAAWGSPSRLYSAMEMHEIRYFIAASELLNFRRAAEKCHVSPPAFTRAIQKLEDEVGGKLFRRERNQTHLTDLGTLIRPQLKRILSWFCWKFVDYVDKPF